MDATASISGYAVFEAIRGNGLFGDIALDDISVTDGPCPTTYGRSLTTALTLRAAAAVGSRQELFPNFIVCRVWEYVSYIMSA